MDLNAYYSYLTSLFISIVFINHFEPITLNRIESDFIRRFLFIYGYNNQDINKLGEDCGMNKNKYQYDKPVYIIFNKSSIARTNIVDLYK